MRQYETGFVLSPALSEEETDAVHPADGRGRRPEEGTNGQAGHLGQAQAGLPIKRFQEGVYVFFTYEGAGDISMELERRFKQTDAVIRFLTVVKDPRDLVRRKKKRRAGRRPPRPPPSRPPRRPRRAGRSERGEVRCRETKDPKEANERAGRLPEVFHAQEEILPVLPAERPGHRLQVRGDPEEIHPRPGQDHPPPDHRDVRVPPEEAGPGRQAGPAHGPSPLRRGLRHESHSETGRG